MNEIQLTIKDKHLHSPYGPILSKGSDLQPVVLVDIWLVAACAARRQAVCPQAQQNLRAGIGYVTRDGFFVLQNETKRVAYELFPARTPDTKSKPGMPIYLGVERARDTW